MKNVRVFYRKFGSCKYISHLDTNRVMLRAIGKSGLNIWRTEGFNQHAYITFALPLSLGFGSECESMDFRVLDDNEDLSAIPDRLNSCLPEGIRVFRCAESVHKPAAIDSAAWTNNRSLVSCRSTWQTWYSSLEPQVHGATPPVISSVAVSGMIRTVYPRWVNAFRIQLMAVDFPAQGPPVITIFCITFIFSPSGNSGRTQAE